MQRVLVLNATLEPLHTVSVPRAVALLLSSKAEMIEAAEGELRSQHVRLPLPLVIRLAAYVRLPRCVPLTATRRGVFRRDNYTCQYCGRIVPTNELTLDHVVPRCRGGQTVWENAVAACQPCNQRKNDRTPAEARMRLLRPPLRPRYVAIVVYAIPIAWRKYLGPPCA